MCAKLTLKASNVCCVHEKADGVGSRSAREKLEEQRERGTQHRKGTDRGEGKMKNVGEDVQSIAQARERR